MPDRPAVEGALDTLAGSGIGADWGARMLSRESALYEPLSYNNGAIWPFLTGFAILGLYEHGRAPAAWAYLDGTADLTFIDGRGYITELLSGDRLRPIDASVPHQLFATFGFVSGLLRGMVGLRADPLVAANGGNAGGLRLRPQLPPGWDRLRLRNLRFRGTKLDLEIERDATALAAAVRIAEGTSPPSITVELPLPVGAETADPEMEDLLVRAPTPGAASPGAAQRERGDTIAWTPRLQDGSDSIRIVHNGGIEIRPLHDPLRLGDSPTRLRVIDAWVEGDAYTARLEGRRGRAYRFELALPFEIESLANAREISRDGNTVQLEVAFPAGTSDWTALDVVVDLGDRREATAR
jgi:hypothetical protein